MKSRWSAMLGPLGILLLAGSVTASDPVAVLTEFSVATGDIGVRRAGASEWTPPQPLLALRAGDQVRVAGDGRAVVVFAGGGVQTVSAANSPFAIQAPRARSATEQAAGVLGGVVRFLLGHQTEPSYESLSVRGSGPESVRIVSPRETRVLAGPLTFEWTGPATLRYHLQLLGPQGLLWERHGLARQPLDYPASVPPLQAGVRYTWALNAPGQPSQRASFDVLSADEAARVAAALAAVRTATGSDYPPSTGTLMRAGLLAQEHLYAAARRELADALAADPDSAGLRLLLGHVYERTGLTELAAREFGEASALSRPKR
ncbi:MAG: hypothetical protein ACREMB_22075 [Candidatus Rokuibacteriota bacterium]